MKLMHAIDDNGHVVDSASGTLRSIRQGLRIQEARVRERLRKLYTWTQCC